MDNERSFDLEYKILLLGHSSSGKKEILNRYLTNKFNHSGISTIGTVVDVNI